MEAVAGFGEELGLDDLWGVVVGVAIVVLEGGKSLVEGDVVDEDGCGPVVDEAAGGGGIDGGVSLLDEDFAGFEFGVAFCALSVRLSVDEEEIFVVGEGLEVAGFDGGDVLVEGGSDLGGEFLGLGDVRASEKRCCGRENDKAEFFCAEHVRTLQEKRSESNAVRVNSTWG